MTQATFEVQAHRRDNRGARDVALPYFATVVQGNGNSSPSASARSICISPTASIAQSPPAPRPRTASRGRPLPEDIRRQITRERRPGDPDAAIDPMADPAVRAAVDRARFELLIGFELTADQLRYNATR